MTAQTLPLLLDSLETDHGPFSSRSALRLLASPRNNPPLQSHPHHQDSATHCARRKVGMDIHFLSHEEVCTLTGAKTKTGQVQVLKRNGIRHPIKRSGWPCVIANALTQTEFFQPALCRQPHGLSGLILKVPNFGSIACRTYQPQLENRNPECALETST